MTYKAKDVYGNLHDVELSEMKWRPSVYGIIFHQDKILLSPQHDIGYDLPGGGVEMHETFYEAVVREVKEETGIDVEPVKIVGCTDSFFVWKPDTANERSVSHSVMVYVLCNMIGGNISIDGFDENEKKYARQAEWIDISVIETLGQASSVDFLPYIREAMIHHGD